MAAVVSAVGHLVSVVLDGAQLKCLVSLFADDKPTVTQHLTFLGCLGLIIALRWAGSEVLCDLMVRVGLTCALCYHVKCGVSNAEREREASESKLRFFSEMCHEMRTPLNGVLGAIDMMMNAGSTRISGSHDDLLDIASTSSEHLKHIVDQVMDFRKLDLGKMELHPATWATPPQLLRSIGLILQPKTSSKNVNLEISVSPTVPTSIKLDVVSFKQCCLNLLSNSVKYTPPEGTVNMILDHVPATGMFSLTVNDTGAGIAPADLPCIFDAYKQSNRSAGGTGLGLAIVKATVTLMEGEVSATSTLNVGSEFKFTFRVEDTAGHEVDSQGQRSCSPRPSVTKKRSMDLRSSSRSPRGPFIKMPFDTSQPIVIEDEGDEEETVADGLPLIVLADDNQTNRRLGCHMLTNIGVNDSQILVAENGRQAVDFVLKYGDRIELILMDLQMPVCDGVEATKELRAKKLKTNIVAMTGRMEMEVRDKCLGLGMNGWLTKPYRISDLECVLNKFCSAKLRSCEKTSEKVPPELLAFNAIPSGVVAFFLTHTKKRVPSGFAFLDQTLKPKAKAFPLAHMDLLWQSQAGAVDQTLCRVLSHEGTTKKLEKFLLSCITNKQNIVKRVSVTSRGLISPSDKMQMASVSELLVMPLWVPQEDCFLLTLLVTIISQETVRDTDHKRPVVMSRQLSTRTLSKAQSNQPQVLFNMAQELRTPLNAIQGNLQFLLHSLTLKNDSLECINTALDCCDQVLTSMNTALDATWANAGLIQPDWRFFSASQLTHKLKDVTTPYLNDFKAKGVRMRFKAVLRPNVWLLFKADLKRISQVVDKFVSNAAKFTSDGHVDLVLELGDSFKRKRTGKVTSDGEEQYEVPKDFQFNHAIAEDESAENILRFPGSLSNEKTDEDCLLWLPIRITVTDTGGGIEQEMQDTVSDTLVNAGLGLSIATIANSVGGKIRMKSCKDVGTEVSLTVPLQLISTKNLTSESISRGNELADDNGIIELIDFSSDLTEPAQELVKVSPPAPTVVGSDSITTSKQKPTELKKVKKKKRKNAKLLHEPVLLVEDNEINIKVALRLLGLHFSNISVARNGQEAVDLVAEKNFSLILMDLQMPVMDGYEATRAIHKLQSKRGIPRGKRVPIVAVTASVLPGDQRSCIDAGMAGHIGKPIKLEELRKVISVVLHKPTLPILKVRKEKKTTASVASSSASSVSSKPTALSRAHLATTAPVVTSVAETASSSDISNHVRHLKASWFHVNLAAVTASKTFYERLFEIDKSVLPLFNGVDMGHQGELLMTTLNGCILSLHDLPSLVKILHASGRRHARYNVQPHHYDSVGAALLWTLETLLGEHWIPEVNAAWVWVYTLIVTFMQEGARGCPGLVSSSTRATEASGETTLCPVKPVQNH